MCQEGSTQGKLFAMRQVIAFLLARESVRAKGPLTDIGNSLIETVKSAIDEVSPSISSEFGVDPSYLADFSESAFGETAALFRMAENYYGVMPDK